MNEAFMAAYIFCALTAVSIAFQLALALGAPWGEMAMGGKYPGRFPPKMRVAAVIQSLLLLLIGLVVLVRAEVIMPNMYSASKTAIWVVVAFCLVGAILNVITQSKKERMLWAPVTIVLVCCSVIVARS